MSKKPASKKTEEKKETPTEKQPEKTLVARWFVIGDPHLRRTDPLGVIGTNGINTRLQDKLDALKVIVAQAVEKKATHIVFLGDIYDSVNPPEILQKLFWETIKPLLHLQIRIIIGNHDSTRQTYNFSGNEVLLPDNVKLIHDHSSTEKILCPDKGSEITIQYVPYKNTKEEVLEELNSCKETPAMVFGHFEVAGAELAPDNTIIRQGVNKEDVRGRLIWLGHIHKYQEFRPGFAYIGSLVKCDFGEVSNTKVYGVVEIYSDGSLKYRYEAVPQRPMYVHDIRENDPNNLYLSEKIPQELVQTGVLIKFRFVGSNEWIKSLDKVGFKKRFSKAMRVNTEDIKIDSDRVKAEYATSQMSDHVHHHIKEKNKGKEYLDVGLEIAKSVAEVEL